MTIAQDLETIESVDLAPYEDTDDSNLGNPVTYESYRSDVERVSNVPILWSKLDGMKKHDL